MPLIWLRPRLSPSWKVGLTLAVLLLTWLLYLATMESVRLMDDYLRLLQEL